MLHGRTAFWRMGRALTAFLGKGTASVNVKGSETVQGS